MAKIPICIHTWIEPQGEQYIYSELLSADEILAITHSLGQHPRNPLLIAYQVKEVLEDSSKFHFGGRTGQLYWVVCAGGIEKRGRAFNTIKIAVLPYQLVDSSCDEIYRRLREFPIGVAADQLCIEAENLSYQNDWQPAIEDQSQPPLTAPNQDRRNRYWPYAKTVLPVVLILVFVLLAYFDKVCDSKKNELKQQAREKTGQPSQNQSDASKKHPDKQEQKPPKLGQLPPAQPGQQQPLPTKANTGKACLDQEIIDFAVEKYSTIKPGLGFKEFWQAIFSSCPGKNEQFKKLTIDLPDPIQSNEEAIEAKVIGNDGNSKQIMQTVYMVYLLYCMQPTGTTVKIEDYQRIYKVIVKFEKIFKGSGQIQSRLCDTWLKERNQFEAKITELKKKIIDNAQVSYKQLRVKWTKIKNKMAEMENCTEYGDEQQLSEEIKQCIETQLQAIDYDHQAGARRTKLEKWIESHKKLNLEIRFSNTKTDSKFYIDIVAGQTKKAYHISIKEYNNLKQTLEQLRTQGLVVKIACKEGNLVSIFEGGSLRDREYISEITKSIEVSSRLILNINYPNGNSIKKLIPRLLFSALYPFDRDIVKIGLNGQKFSPAYMAIVLKN